MGTVTLHGVNAKTMKLHTDLKMRWFDRVIFNLPHSGFKGKEDQPHMIKYVHFVSLCLLYVEFNCTLRQQHIRQIKRKGLFTLLIDTQAILLLPKTTNIQIYLLELISALCRFELSLRLLVKKIPSRSLEMDSILVQRIV